MAGPAVGRGQRLGMVGRLALAAVSPVSGVWSRPSPTHDFINLQALRILEADGHWSAVKALWPYVEQIQLGSAWADGGSRNVTHMYDPTTGRGIRGWPHAASVCGAYFESAVSAWHQGRRETALFYLGAACHLVQDLCVPHHAACRLLDGHREFEHFARRRRRQFAVVRDGLYNVAEDPAGWVVANARIARTYLPLAGAEATETMKEIALSVLLPRAQRTTAGFLAFFLEAVGCR